MYYNRATGSTGSVYLPLADFGPGRYVTQGSGVKKMELIDSGAVEKSANRIPITRQFTVEGRIWEPDQVKSRMIGDAKLRRLLDDNDNDRISNLPGELIHCILAYLPVRDVVRTSVLSKTWRNIWKLHPRLILDRLFLLQLIPKKNESRLSAFSAAVDMIFSIHTGPLSDFNLYVPPNLHKSHIHRWMEHLSNKGTRDLNLFNSGENACSIPSYIFDCSELTRLSLSKWTLSPPHKSGCFANLISVDLVDVSITADISFGNQLQKLNLLRCKGIQHLSCHFTHNNNLRRLAIFLCETIDWRCFEYPKELETFALLSSSGNYNVNKSVNLISLLGNSPRINCLLLDNHTLEVLGPAPPILERLTAKMVNLKKMRLFKLGYNLCQISTSLCLIRNLPNLQVLYIALNMRILDPLRSTTERYLESVDWTDVFLNQLLSVEIGGIVGSRSALHLIKLLLASSPSLRVLSLFCSKKACNTKEKFRIEQELLQLPRISSHAQLFWHTIDV